MTRGRVPRPGAPVRGSTTGRPMMAALDLLGRRWMMRVVWELQQEPAGFRELRRRCDEMSSSVLSERLSALRDAGIASVDEDGVYRLTPVGARLNDALAPLFRWSHEWAEELSRRG
jgi:DNA-binding HxlR family transcriptional regulator